MSKVRINIKLDVQTGKAIANIKGVETEFKNLNTAVKTAATATKSMNDNAGLAGATVQALGQGIGDLRYGFGAVANNISQVGSLMGALAAKAGTAKQAVKDLKKAFVGPLGILFAFQVIVAAVDFFISRQEKAAKASKDLEKATKALNNEISKQTTELNAVMRSYELGSLAGDDLKDVVSDLNNKYHDANLALDDNNKLTEKSLGWINGSIEAAKSLAKNRALMTELTNLYSDSLEANTIVGQKNYDMMAKIEELAELKAKRDEARANGQIGIVDTLNKSIRYREGELKDIATDLGELITDRERIQTAIDNKASQLDYTGLINGGDKGDKIDRPKNLTGLDSGLEATGVNTDALMDPEVMFQQSKNETLINLQRNLNNELDAMRNADLIAERFTSEGKMAIQQAYMSHTRRALGLAQGLMGENNKLKGAAIIAEKALAIGQVLMNDSKSRSAAFTHAQALGPIAGAGYLATQNALTTANTAGSVAAIGISAATALGKLKQGGGGSSAQGPRGGAAGGGGTQFDFNLVGQNSSTQNAIANSITAQQGNEPVQAYVVQNDISNAQDLQDNIINNVTIGN